MHWCPLGRFNCDFSIVSAVRGQYITANESCQFYYQLSKAPQIKNTTSYFTLTSPLVSQNSSTWSVCYSSPPFINSLTPLFPFPSLYFVYPCQCFVLRLCSWRKPPPRFTFLLSVYGPLLLGMFTGGPIKKGASQKAETATGKPWGPPPHGSQLFQLQDQRCTLPASHGSVCLPVVSISSVGFLS